MAKEIILTNREKAERARMVVDGNGKYQPVRGVEKIGAVEEVVYKKAVEELGAKATREELIRHVYEKGLNGLVVEIEGTPDKKKVARAVAKSGQEKQAKVRRKTQGRRINDEGDDDAEKILGRQSS